MAKKNNSKKEAPAACELAALKKRYAVRAAAGLCSGAALAALVLGVLAVVKAARHLASAQGTRAYTELPLAVSIIALFGTVAMVGFGAWSILH